MATVLTAKKSTPDAQTKAGLRLLCQTDLYALAKVVLARDRAPEDNTITDAFHKPLCEYMQTTRWARNLYLLARDHLKTALITAARTTQRILQNPTHRHLIASNKAENAEAMLATIKGYLQNPVLVWCFPEILWPDPAHQAERWTNSAIIVKGHRKTDASATVETIGVEGEITSKHYDHGVFDDIVGFENSQTREALTRTIAWMEAAESLFEPWATVTYVGTPWHYADVWASVIAKKIKHGLPLGIYREPCWRRVLPEGTAPGSYLVDAQGAMVPDVWALDEAGQRIPALPERFSYAKLMERKTITVGPTRFAAQYELNPNDETTTVFARSQLVIRPSHEMPAPETLWMAMTIDPAISEHKWADYTAMAVGGFDREGHLYLYELRRGRWDETRLLNATYEMFGAVPGIRVIGFEAVAFAKAYQRLYQYEGEHRGVYLPIVKLERDTTRTKNTRIMGLEPLWARGRIIVSDRAEALTDLLDEAEKFRPTREAAHDDLLDAVADLLQLRQRPAAGLNDPHAMTDPGLLERQRFEWALVQQRQQEGLAPMDRGSLRAAWSMHQVYQAEEQERAARVLGADADEFWGGG